MEPFDLSVGLWAVGTGAFRGDPQRVAGVAPGVGAVGRAVVGQDSAGGDPAGGEPGHRAAQHSDRGGGGLVVVDLGVGQAGVVVEHGVHERRAHLRLVVGVAKFPRGRGPVAVSLGAPDIAPAAAVGDVAQLLHIHVQQIPGGGVFVAAHRFSGGAVDMGEAVDPTPHQHPVHGRGSDTDPVGDLDRAQALLPAQVHDPAHHRCRRRPRRVVRPAGAIGHAGRAVGAVAVGPAFRGRPGHLEPGSGRSDRHVALDDQTRQAQSAAFGQWSVSVDHEDLLWLWVRVPSTAPHPPQEVLTLQDQLDRVVTRVRPTSPVSTASARRGCPRPAASPPPGPPRRTAAVAAARSR
ncbi:hypothetical protein BG618_03878 [Pseudonocardia autotrophica]|nr:hypothetical protein BG618_03878 [Pseudonocardia autotrophica]